MTSDDEDLTGLFAEAAAEVTASDELADRIVAATNSKPVASRTNDRPTSLGRTTFSEVTLDETDDAAGADRRRSTPFLLAVAASLVIMLGGISWVVASSGGEPEGTDGADDLGVADPGPQTPTDEADLDQSDGEDSSPSPDQLEVETTDEDLIEGDAWAFAPDVDVVIESGRRVVLAEAVSVASLRIESGGALVFDPEASASLRSTGNVVVDGLLSMRPNTSPDVEHVVEFVGIDVDSFVGGDGGVLDTDVGLWVRGDGQLVAEGWARRGWTRAPAGVSAGQTSFEVVDAAGWQVGDEVVISPTAIGAYDDGFHQATVSAVSGNTVTIDRGPGADHPVADAGFGPEIINLTRNVIIRGSQGRGRSHLHIASRANPQFLRWVALDHLGAGYLDDTGFNSVTKPNRHPLFFDNTGTTAAGSLIEGVVIANSGHGGVVPENSHGLTFRDVSVYRAIGTGFGWDGRSDDLLFDRPLAAGVSGSGFLLSNGHNINLVDGVAVGGSSTGNPAGFSGLFTSGQWAVTGAVSHNNRSHGFRFRGNEVSTYFDDVRIYRNRSTCVSTDDSPAAFFYPSFACADNGSGDADFDSSDRPSGDVGLFIEYFDGINFSDRYLAWIGPAEEGIDFAPVDGATAHHALESADGSSVRWSGELEIPEGDEGSYQLCAAANGRVRLTIDGRAVIDQTESSGRSGSCATADFGYEVVVLDLVAGRHPIVIEVANEGHGPSRGRFSFDLTWQRPGTLAFEPIPIERFRPSQPRPFNPPAVATIPN